MRAASAIVIALAGCPGSTAPTPHTPPAVPLTTSEPSEPDEPPGVEPPAIDAGAAPLVTGSPPVAARVWLAPTPVSWPKERTKAQFHGLGGGTPWSVAVAVSADGSTPVGIARPVGGADEAVRWSDGTMSPLATLDLDGDDSSTAWAVSRDGKIVVGQSTATHTSALPVRWGPDGKATRLPLPAGVDSAESRAVSRDGKVIAGCTGGGCDAVVRWSGASAPSPVAASVPFYLAAHPMTDDGKVLAGNEGAELEHAVRIDASGRADVFKGTRVEAISDDGTVMVGNVGTRAVLWRGKGAPVDLGVVDGYTECYARAVSADGGRVIGNCIRRSGYVPVADEPRTPPPPDPQASVAFVWDKRRGMRTVADALADAGAKLPDGWWLDEAFDICAYGVTIVGDARSPGSTNEAWMAIVPR